MPEAARRMPIWDDILALGEDVHAEILDGELVIHASPGPHHSRVATGLSHDIFGPFDRGRDGPGGWWILTEVDIALDNGAAVRPDLVGWRRERVPTFPHERPVDIRPDWVCEVLSPSNSSYDLGPKRDIYHGARVPYLWIADPEHRVVVAHEWSERGYVVVATGREAEPARLPPFDAIEIELTGVMPPRPDR